MKILVPTDLSPLSKVAVVYAAKLSRHCDSRLLLLNVFYIDPPTRTLSEFTTSEVLAERRAQREKECRDLVEEIRPQVEGELSIEILVEEGGSLAEKISATARDFGCDLIVMGTKGASGLKKSLMGSNAAAVINKSGVPVLTVPEYAIFTGLRDLVYASDLRNIHEEFRLLMPLIRKFGAKVHLLHVYQQDAPPLREADALARDLQQQLDYPDIICHYILGAGVGSGVEQFLNGRNAELIAMFSGKRNFFERLFEKSSAREVVFESKVPLLTFSKPD